MFWKAIRCGKRKHAWFTRAVYDRGGLKDHIATTVCKCRVWQCQRILWYTLKQSTWSVAKSHYVHADKHIVHSLTDSCNTTWPLSIPWFSGISVTKNNELVTIWSVRCGDVVFDELFTFNIDAENLFSWLPLIL